MHQERTGMMHGRSRILLEHSIVFHERHVVLRARSSMFRERPYMISWQQKKPLKIGGLTAKKPPKIEFPKHRNRAPPTLATTPKHHKTHLRMHKWHFQKLVSKKKNPSGFFFHLLFHGFFVFCHNFDHKIGQNTKKTINFVDFANPGSVYVWLFSRVFSLFVKYMIIAIELRRIHEKKIFDFCFRWSDIFFNLKKHIFVALFACFFARKKQ